MTTPACFRCTQPIVPDGKVDRQPTAQGFGHQPESGGIMVAFGIREALGPIRIWAEIGKRQFRQFISEGDVYPAIIVDDILRSGRALRETIDLVTRSEVIGVGTIAKR